MHKSRSFDRFAESCLIRIEVAITANRAITTDRRHSLAGTWRNREIAELPRRTACASRFEFSPDGRFPTMQNCPHTPRLAWINLLDVKPPRAGESVFPANLVSRSGRARARKSILPECEKAFSAVRRSLRHAREEREREIFDLSISCSPSRDNVRSAVRHTPNRHKRISADTWRRGSVRGIYICEGILYYGEKPFALRYRQALHLIPVLYLSEILLDPWFLDKCIYVWKMHIAIHGRDARERVRECAR